MSLKLFMITWPENDWDTCEAKIIASQSEELALMGRGSFSATREEASPEDLQVECIGVAHPRYKEGDIVLESWKWG
jgi:hypothetical protein